MNPHVWNPQHRDALLTRVTLLTAGTAVVAGVGAVGLGAGLAASSASSTHKALTGATSRTTPAPAKTSGSGSSDGSSTGLALTADQVQVEVLNGTGIAGSARAAADDLVRAGFRVVAIGNASQLVGASFIAYPGGSTEAVRLLERSTGVASVTTASTGGPLVLVVGPDWAGSKPVVTAPRPAGSGGGGGGSSSSSSGSGATSNGGGGGGGPVVSSGGS